MVIFKRKDLPILILPGYFLWVGIGLEHSKSTYTCFRRRGSRRQNGIVCLESSGGSVWIQWSKFSSSTIRMRRRVHKVLFYICITASLVQNLSFDSFSDFFAVRDEKTNLLFIFLRLSEDTCYDACHSSPTYTLSSTDVTVEKMCSNDTKQ